MLLKLLFFFLLLYLIIRGLKKAFVYAVQKVSIAFCPENFKFVPGDHLISIKQLRGKGKYFSINIEDARLRLNFTSVFGLSRIPIISFTFEKFFINLNETDFNSLKKEKAHEEKSLSFEMWTIQQFLLFILFQIFRRIHFEFNNLIVQVKGYQFSIQEVLFLFKKKQKNFDFHFTILNFVVSQKEPLLRVPIFQINILLNTYALRHIMSTFIDDFSFKIDKIRLQMKDGVITTTISPLVGKAINDKEADLSIDIHQIKAMMPSTSVTTTSFDVEIYQIERTVTEQINVGQILVSRLKQNVITIPSVTLAKSDLIIPSIDANIDTSLILDVMMIAGITIRTPTHPFNPKPFIIPVNAFIDRCSVNLALSDMHKVYIDATTIRTSRISNSVFISLIKIIPNIDGKDYPLGTGKKLFVYLKDEVNFRIKIKDLSVDLTPEYAILQYIKSAFMIFKYILNSYKGPNNVVPPNEPPTPFKITFDCKKGHIYLLKKEIVDSIERSIESKRISMEGLSLRREKSIQILQAQGIKTINLDKFEEKSKEILWKLYRNTYEETKKVDRFFGAEVTKFHLHFDGFKFLNVQQAIDKIVEIHPRTNTSELGLLDGGEVTVTVDKVDFIGSRFGTVLRLDKTDTIFDLLIAPILAFKEDNVYKYDISCNNGKLNLLIPDTSTNTSFLIKGNFHSKNALFKYSPAVQEIIEDIDFAMKDPFLSLFQFVDIKKWDMYRIMFHLIGNITFDIFEITYTDAIRPFSHKPLITITLPNFLFGYDGDKFDMSFDSFTLFFNSGNNSQRILKLPRFVMKCDFISINFDNPDNSPPPLFINIEASRYLDRNYDPYADFRTNLYKLNLDIDCTTNKNEHALLNIDIFQPVINEIIANPAPCFSTFFSFISLPPKAMKFAGLSANIKFPSFIVSLLNEQLTSKVSAFTTSLDFSLINKDSEESTSTVSIPKFDAIFSSLGQHLGVLTFEKFNLKTIGNHKNNITLNSISADMQPQLITMLMELDINFPESKETDPLIAPAVINQSNIDSFTKEAASNTSILLKKITVQLLDGSNFPPRLTVDDFTFSILVNDKRESIKVLQFEQFQICTSYFTSHPLMRSNQMKLNFAMDSTHFAIYLQMNGSTEVHFRPADFDVIIPQLKMFLPAAMKPKLEEKSGSEMTMNIVISIEHSIIINFMKNDDKVLAMVMATGFTLTHISGADGSEDTKSSLMHLKITDETSTDEFHEAFCSTSDKPQFSMIMQERKKTMKCPVFNKINISLNPFDLHVSLKFIDEMIKFFPSTLDLNIFDFDQSDMNEEKVQTNQVYLGGASKDDDSEVVGFYRRVRIDPFVAMMSYRGLPESFIQEILHREFHFDKIQLTDLFGTKDQIKEIIKHELKWNIIKALPKMALKAK